MTRSKGKKGNLLWVAQVVHISEPPVSSPAALALLAKHYYALDRSIYSELRMTRLRNKWMRLQMKSPDSEGGLICALCGKKGLKYQGATRKGEKATLDHIVEIVSGGDWRDTSNFQVACYACNTNKNTLMQKRKTP